MIAILPTGDHRYLPYSLTPPPPGGALARARRTAALVAPEAAALHPRHIPEDEEVHVLAPSEAGLERAGLACVEIATPGKLDVDIVGNTLKENPEIEVTPFIRRLVTESDPETREAFQAFLADHLLSSHIRILVSID